MKKTKIIAAIAAMTTLTASTPNVTTAAMQSQFSDVPYDAWYVGYVERLAQDNGINGYEDGTFRPEGTITNAEFVKTVVALTVGEQENGTDHWADNYMAVAVENNIVPSGELSSSDYDTPIDRQHMAKYVMNAIAYVIYPEYKMMAFNLSDDEEAEIPDWSEIGSDCVKHVSSALYYGIMKGYEDKTFKPVGTATRAEASTVLARMIEESYRVDRNTGLTKGGQEISAVGEPTTDEKGIYTSFFYEITEDNCTVEDFNRALAENEAGSYYATEYMTTTGAYTLKAQLLRENTTLYWNDPNRPAAIPGDVFVAEDGTEYVLEVTTYTNEYGSWDVLAVGLPIAVDLGRVYTYNGSSVTIEDDRANAGGFFGWTMSGYVISGSRYYVYTNGARATGEGHTQTDWDTIRSFTKPSYKGTTDGEYDETGYWLWDGEYWDFMPFSGKTTA